VKTTRRQFIRAGTTAGTAFLLTSRGRVLAAPQIGSPPLTKFFDRMPMFITDIPLAKPTVDPVTGADYYRIALAAYKQKLHSQAGPTTLWGYADATGGAPVFQYLGAPILAKYNRPVRVKFVSYLPATHPLPVDDTIPYAAAAGLHNRAAIHLHGGHVPWVSDGGPFHWFTPDGGPTGPSVVQWLPDATGALTNDYWYPNDQTSRFMWYHDHAVGITRLNAYAGLATGYIITDVLNPEGGIEKDWVSGGLPFPGIVMVLQEKQFKASADQWGNTWDLWYPSAYDPADLGPNPTLPLPYPSCVPEFFGDTTVINGVVCPYIVVKPQFQRFRILNGAQSRFYNLRLFEEKPAGKQADLGKPGPRFTVIGTEGGFLPQPADVYSDTPTGYVQGEATVPYHLLLGPAERTDLLIDFRGLAGKRFVLYNDAPGPFPDGDPVIDSSNGRTPDTANLLEIIVADTGDAIQGSDAVALANYGIAPLKTSGVKPILKTLNEGYDPYGRLIQTLGTDHSLPYLAPVTEFGAPGDVQVWDVYNTTADSHPIHFHLVNVQVLGRAPFSTVGENVSGSLVPPDAYEKGWKETVRMNPGTVTRVAMMFDIPPAPFPIPVSPRLGTVVEKNKTYGFYEYVWHCHILEHEEHDMMRPFAVKVQIK
jgi:spore coat protein A